MVKTFILTKLIPNLLTKKRAGTIKVPAYNLPGLFFTYKIERHPAFWMLPALLVNLNTSPVLLAFRRGEAL